MLSSVMDKPRREKNTEQRPLFEHLWHCYHVLAGEGRNTAFLSDQIRRRFFKSRSTSLARNGVFEGIDPLDTISLECWRSLLRGPFVCHPVWNVPLEKNSRPRLLVSRLGPRVQRRMCWCLAGGCLAPSARCLAWSARCWCRTAWGLGDPASYTQDSSPAACTLHHTLRLPPGNQWIIYCTVDVFEGLSNGIHSFSSTKWIFKSEAYPSYSGWIILNVLMPVKDFLKQRKIEIHLSQRRGILMSHRMAEVAREHGWPKSWARTKILSPNIHYFVAN